EHARRGRHGKRQHQLLGRPPQQLASRHAQGAVAHLHRLRFTRRDVSGYTGGNRGGAMKARIAALLVGLVGGRAWADEVSSAKAHYLRATSHFAVGEYSEAASDYETAYKLHPDPALLFDAAQAHRLAGHHEKALLLYRSYLRLYPNGGSANA